MQSGDFSRTGPRTRMDRMSEQERRAGLLGDIGRGCVALAVLVLLALLDRVA